MSTVFFHIDLDAFFASVEILDHPEYANKPLIIGSRSERSVCSTCSYEARKYGVHSAMPISRALKLCPNALIVEPRMKRYSEKSHEVMAIIRSFSAGFLQVSVDEAFLDMSNMENIYGLPGKAAKLLKAKIKDQTGLTVSIGVASSRFLAKLASDYHKPDGLTIVPPERSVEFVDKVGLRKLYGIGEKTYERLLKKGISSTENLRTIPLEKLKRMFGESLSEYLYKVSRAIDPGIYQNEAKSHSISTESTFFPDVYGMHALLSILLEMSQELSFRSLDEKVVPRTVAIKIRYGDFSTFSAQETPEDGIYSSSDIYTISERLLKKTYNNQGVRLLGLSLDNLYNAENVEQKELFREKSEKERLMEKAILNIQKKNKDIKIVKAGTLNSSYSSLKSKISDDKNA